MNTATKVCKTCGKTYEACRTVRSNSSVFRWQDVACSPECGQKYLTAIKISRGEIQSEQNEVESNIVYKYIELGFIDDDFEDDDEINLDDYFD